MNKEKIIKWKWKNTIIDFNAISDELADYGNYLTKKDMVFHYLGTPDNEIHEWYNGGYSCEYNSALTYAKQLGLVENYIDYEDRIYKLQNALDEIEKLINTILNFSFFKEECPLNFSFEDNSKEDKAQNIFYSDEYCENNCNDIYKDCWLKYFKELQKVKGDGK